MKQMRMTMWFAVGCGAASATLGVVACSASAAPIDDGSTTVTPDASKPDSYIAPSGQDSGTTPPDPGTDAGASGTCASPPKLYPPSSKGIYCPYSASGDAGSQYCKIGSQVCCLSPSSDAGPSTCASGSCPPADSPWACAAPEECGGGQVCCLVAGPVGADPNCSGYQKTKGFANTHCVAASACTGTVDAGKYTDNQYVVCTKQADCASGTCTAIKTSGTSIGVCL
jgi:hypothetical protein